MIKLLVMTSGKRRTRVARIAFSGATGIRGDFATRDPGATGTGEGFQWAVIPPDVLRARRAAAAFA
jgi:hypothetical protein